MLHEAAVNVIREAAGAVAVVLVGLLSLWGAFRLARWLLSSYRTGSGGSSVSAAQWDDDVRSQYSTNRNLGLRPAESLRVARDTVREVHGPRPGA
jgi:hypothetical protein